MGDRQWPNPRGWEALTQQEAEQDARRRDLDQLREWLVSDGVIYGCTLTPGEAHLLVDAFDAVVRERDQAREALRPFVTRGVAPDAPARPMTFEEGQFVVWMRRDEVEAARAALAGGWQT